MGTNADSILFLPPDNHLLVEKMLRGSPIIRCLGIFALAFVIRQATAAFFSNTSYETDVVSLGSFGIILITVLVIRFSDRDFREHGFLLPKRASRLFGVSLLLAFVYVLVVIFVPGSVSGFEASPGLAISWDLLFSAGSIILAVFAAEVVFRGYVQTGLEKALGSYVSIALVSVLFTLYMLPITAYFTADFAGMFGLALPFLAESLFLCFFFSETKTLMCTIAFAATATILETITPLEPTASDYTTLVTLMCYVFLVPIMQMFVAEVKEQNARTDIVPDLDEEDQIDTDMRLANRFE
jgi:membrane protease YdiL (CAAX protease family)